MSQITIQLDNAVAAYLPGASISGTIVWQIADPPAESLEIRLLWFTRGKGDRDYDVVDSVTIPVPQASDQAPFEFLAPAWPISFSGKLISLIWAVEVILFPDRQAENREIVISPVGEPLLTRTHSSMSGDTVR